MSDAALGEVAAAALTALRAAGFDSAQATASRRRKEEINVAHGEPSLMRSTLEERVALVGIAGGRRATTELASFDAAAIAARARALAAEAAAAPVDAAHAVSTGQVARIVQGPPDADLDALAEASAGLLAFRAAETPKVLIDESFVAHNRLASHTVGSSGSDLACDLGWYETSVLCTARDGRAASSFNAAGGAGDAIDGPLAARFGIGRMLRDSERQLHATPIGARFEGEVVLLPNAVVDLLTWLLGQLDDMRLIAGTSLYADKVGEAIASPSLTMRSRFDAPGTAPQSADACVAGPVDVVVGGRLQTLLPSLYGSRKTGRPHVPIAAAGGWQLDAGQASEAELVEGVARGAVVGRLSMGRPAANGDFSGVIKNSFRVDDGRVGAALSETMIAGNVARMLEAVQAVGRERIDAGPWLLPALRVGGLHFS